MSNEKHNEVEKLAYKKQNVFSFYDKANDGKDVHEIICLTILPEEYSKVKNNLIFTENTPSEDKFFVNSNNGTDLFNKIWREMWKMW